LRQCWAAVRIAFRRRHNGRARPSVSGVTSLRVQLLRFAVVGVANTAITLGAYAVALGAGVGYLPAGAAAYALGGANGFLLNRAWTFSHKGRALPAAARYAAVTALGIVANLALLRAAVGFGVPRVAAQAAAVAPVTLLTFALNRAWAFSQDVPPLPHALVAGRPRRGLRRAAHAGGADPATAGDGG
jgi:putative flippase GtrA